MFESDAFRAREQALENEFFYRVDRELLSQLKQRLADDTAKQALASASGLTDDRLLEELVHLHIAPETLASVLLVPLVLIAWADGSVDERERQAVLESAVEDGLYPEHPSYRLLEFWLENQPTLELRMAWRHYVQAVAAGLSDEARAMLRDHLLQEAQRVAKAAGGHLGLGRISNEEKQVLAELEHVLVEASTS